jgi:hypothetical protein
MKLKTVVLAVAAILLSSVVASDLIAASCAPSKTLSCGTTVTDSISATGAACVINTFPTAVYAFNGTAGQTLDLLASDSSGFDIGLSVTDPTGKPVTSGFDEPASAHAVLAVTGQYLISVNFGNPHQSGSFTLTTSCTTSTSPPPTECFYTSTINIGGSVAGQLVAADAICWGDGSRYAKAYRVPVIAGDTFEVDYSASFQPYIEIKGPDTSSGYRWAVAPTKSLTTFYVAPISGDVTIFATANSTLTTGTFTLTILPVSNPPCGKARAVRH